MPLFRSKKKWKGPRHPWIAEQLARELELLGTYGLRNKRELWRAHTELSRIRRQARELLAAPEEVRVKEEKRLLESLYRKGLVGDKATLDDVLGLTVEDLLERRLQTIVWKKGLAKTIYQARQLVVHGHIEVGGRRVDVPGYLVGRDEEETVKIREGSPMLAQVVKDEREG
ncbi:MAG: 30S ribosomal protein S4 [Thaumarchaeota archaeon]|nr:30S ribosomal protein S4 [Nitrososphaerota archaeon]